MSHSTLDSPIEDEATVNELPGNKQGKKITSQAFISAHSTGALIIKNIPKKNLPGVVY